MNGEEWQRLRGRRRAKEMREKSRGREEQDTKGRRKNK